MRIRAWLVGLGAAIVGVAACSRMRSSGNEAPMEAAKASLGELADSVDRAFESVWDSREDCRELLGEKRVARSGARPPRIGTWNVRYFPDGSKTPDGGVGTDVAWLACAMAWVDADVWALQEIRGDAEAKRAAGELIAGLDELTGGEWELALDDCGGAAGLHVGVLYDRSRVKLGARTELHELQTGACDDESHPGLATYLRFAGGRDLYVVSVHLPSGEMPAAAARRTKALSGLPDAYRRLQQGRPDSDVVLVGDFNTHGCKTCEHSASDEVGRIARQLAKVGSGFVRVPSDLRCTEYHDGEPWLFDHFFVTKAAFGDGVRAHVHGYCRKTECEADETPPAAANRLSDHCPVVIELPPE